MLILSRVAGESIRIDEHIRIEVVSVKGGRVRIGIAAPPTVIVDREEIWQLKQPTVAVMSDTPKAAPGHSG